MTRKILVLPLLVALLAASCGGGDDGQEAAAGGSPTPGVTPTATPDGGETAVPATPGSEDEAPAPEDGVEEPAPTAAGAGGHDADDGSDGGPRQQEASSPTVPKAGKYGFHEEGTRRAGTTGTDQPYETDGTLTVTRDGKATDLTFSSSEGEEEMDLRHEPSEVLLTHVRFRQGVTSFETTFDPPQVVLKWPVEVGQSWTNEWSADGTEGTTEITVARRETIRAMGRDWETFVIENHTETSGEAEGTQDSTSWYSPKLGLDVKRVADFEGTYQGVPFDRHSERMLTSRP